MSKYEVGIVYRHRTKLYLAVDDGLLLTFNSGKPHVSRPKKVYEAMRYMSFDDLCSRWGIDSDMLDKAAAKYFAPSLDGAKSPTNIGRRNRDADVMIWELLRTAKISKKSKRV